MTDLSLWVVAAVFIGTPLAFGLLLWLAVSLFLWWIDLCNRFNGWKYTVVAMTPFVLLISIPIAIGVLATIQGATQ